MYNLLANSVNWKTFALVLAIFFVIALIFAVLILVVTKLCKVDEDKKAAQILELLGGSNCGGCGSSGCAAFAKSLVEGKGKICDCHSTTKEHAAQIAKILGVDAEDGVPTVAVVKCSGGINAKHKFEYAGYTNCTNLASFQGGDKCCPHGCLGGSDCKAKCEHGAIEITDGVSTINKKLCVSCGACINACPKGIIERIPLSAKVYVACSSKCKGREVMNACTKGCIGCGICEKNCPYGAIKLVDNLPVIDYNKCTGCMTCVSKCPRKTIREF